MKHIFIIGTGGGGVEDGILALSIQVLFQFPYTHSPHSNELDFTETQTVQKFRAISFVLEEVFLYPL